jgi:magnesium-transporting ATPase (P-type)
LGLLEAALCYIGYLSTYLFSGNAGLLNIQFLSNIHWPTLFTISGDANGVAGTVFLAGVVTVQIGNAFACRTSKAHTRQLGWGSNKVLLGGIALSLLIIAGLVYISPLAKAFDNEVFPLVIWVLLLFYAPVLYILEWLRKGIIRRTGKPIENHQPDFDERRK